MALYASDHIHAARGPRPRARGCRGVAADGFGASYLGVGNETRRLMWTLAHAHGIGLSLVEIGFGATCAVCPELPLRAMRMAARLLNSALVLIPCGFLLGGVVTYGGDPSLGVLLVPLGALSLLAALVSVVWALRAR